MPYTALQTLGWLAHHSKWERAFNVNRAFLRHAQGLEGDKCGIVVGRKRGGKRSHGGDGLGRRRKRQRALVVVFKAIVGTGNWKDGMRGRRQCRKSLRQEAKGKMVLPRGHAGCGALDCKFCGKLAGMCCRELEGQGDGSSCSVPVVEEADENAGGHDDCVGIETFVAGCQ